jgi:hypothetical protein
VRRGVQAILLVLCLGACVPTPPTTALTKDDPFRPYREIETGVFRYGNHPGVMAIKLVAQVDRKSGQTVTLLKVHHSYTGQHRHNYESARNAKAEPLKFTSVARYGNCQVRTNCPIDEMYMVDIPEADLKSAGPKGYPFKVFPRTGPDVVITVPPEMITSLFALLEADRRGPAAAPTKKAAT